MMCDKCKKNPATTHIKTVTNGVVNETNLCSYCAAEQGYNNFGKISLTNMLASMFGDGIGKLDSVTTRCNCCGAAFSDIVESGRLGCSECYNVFKEHLMPSLIRLHGKASHIGNRPAGVNEENNQQKINDLKENLKLAVKNEEFETAAKIRDQIKELEGNK